MKKIISVMLSAALTVNSGAILSSINSIDKAVIVPLYANAAGTQYEFEKGTISNSGENTAEVSRITGASGGMAVDLRDTGNSVSLKVEASEAGAHRITIRYSQPYDEAGKYQNLFINGKNVGEIFCKYTGEGKFDTISVNAELKKGSNDITVEASWGWTYIDALLVEKGSFSSYSGGSRLSNPKASAQAQSLYNFLCDTYGKNVISGQQESTWMGSEDYEFDIIKNASGKYPALRGLDYMGDDFSGCNRRAKKWYDKGGIVTICWHCGSDFRGSHTESMNTNLNWNSALTPGTNEYNALISGMDKG
ncbi:MAG: beta-mannosidase, partial [Ruminococcus sp.]|nr:beta-mannosidase [Ruminococcus sp.]